MALSRAQPCEVYVQSGQLAGRGLSLFGVGLRKKWTTTKKIEKSKCETCVLEEKGC